DNSRRDVRKDDAAGVSETVGLPCFGCGIGPDPAISADLDALPALNAVITESSISGLSSGAFMAVQFGTAWLVITGHDCSAPRSRLYKHK
ncbi:MAG: hypothetical protein WA693_20215, partial [Pseudolabrys sp.]